jgi:ribosomal protein S13
MQALCPPLSEQEYADCFKVFEKLTSEHQIQLKWLSDAKMKRLTAQLKDQFAESAKLERAIRENLKKVGYGI